MRYNVLPTEKSLFRMFLDSPQGIFCALAAILCSKRLSKDSDHDLNNVQPPQMKSTR
jgi:hypothetical protein